MWHYIDTNNFLIIFIGFFVYITSDSWPLAAWSLLDMVKFVMCTLVSRVHMGFYILTKRVHSPWMKPEGTHDKLNHQIPNLNLIKFIMCTLVSRVHMTLYILTKGYTVPGNKGTHDKLNQNQTFNRVPISKLCMHHTLKDNFYIFA